MKQKLLETVSNLREQGIVFSETPPLFKWKYEEEPTLEFQLLIVDVTTEGTTSKESDIDLH